MRSLAAIMRKADAPPRARLRAIDILLLQPHQAGVPEQVRADVALLEWSQVDAVATSCYGPVLHPNPFYLRSVPAEHQRLDRQQQRLNAQQQGVHKADGIDGVQGNPPNGAGLLLGDLLVIADLGVKYTAAARRQIPQGDPCRATPGTPGLYRAARHSGAMTSAHELRRCPRRPRRSAQRPARRP